MRKSNMPCIVAILAVLSASAALADPPSHAPAHGWRKKNDPEYVGYTGTKWERDYGVTSGRCNREEIGAVLGGAAGAAIGSRSDEHRAVATILGAAAGALIGAAIGRELDEADRGCVAHVLEMGGEGRSVRWVNPNTGVNFLLVPDAGKKQKNKACRGFVLTATLNGKKEVKKGKACQAGAGHWQLN